MKIKRKSFTPPATGRLRLKTLESGILIRDSGWISNLVVEDSAEATSAIFNGDIDPLTEAKIAIGTSNAPPATGNSALLAQVAEAYRSSSTAVGPVYDIYAEIPTGWAGTWQEAGLFFGSYLFSRVLDSGDKAATQVVSAHWELTFNF